MLDFTGTMLHYARVSQALRSAPSLHEKIALVADEGLREVRRLDGVADGLIDRSPRVPLQSGHRPAALCGRRPGGGRA